MALTRKLLESLGLESDKIGAIIEAHAETVDALKSQIDTYKADADQLATVKRELGTAQAELESLKGGDWKAKYEKEHSDFETFKASKEAEASEASKVSAYRQLLKDAGISSDKRLDAILRVSDLTDLELTDGKFANAEELSEKIKTEWAEFIPNSNTTGANVQKPPANNGNQSYTPDDIRKMSAKEINENWEAISKSLKGNE